MMRASALFVLWVVYGLGNAYTVTNNKMYMLKNIDPIKSPGTFDSHIHSFFGSDAVGVDMPTSKQLQAGCTSGDNPNDMSVYCELLRATEIGHCINSRQ